MIIKKRELPLSIKKLQALLRRTPSKHLKIPAIEENLAKRLAGYKGEHSIDYPLSFLPEKNYFILHDIRLLHNHYYFQIDSLVISSRFILILEVKNIAGTLFFDQEFKQLIRTIDGKEEAFPYPLIQTQRHEDQLKDWLLKNKFPDIPITSLVIISNPKSILRTNPGNNLVPKKVIHRDVFPSWFKLLEQDFKIEWYSENEIKKLIRILLKKHTAIDSPILEQFQMKKDDLLKGVQCPYCGFLPLQRIYGNWACPSCSIKTKDAHQNALIDYSLLIDSTITSIEARDFLQISSPYLATRLLHSACFTYTGTKKGRIYYLIENEHSKLFPGTRFRQDPP